MKQTICEMLSGVFAFQWDLWRQGHQSSNLSSALQPLGMNLFYTCHMFNVQNIVHVSIVNVSFSYCNIVTVTSHLKSAELLLFMAFVL